MQRFNKLCITTTNQRTLTKLDILGKDFDSELKLFQKSLQGTYNEVNQKKNGFAIAFDNIDIRQERKYMTKVHQNTDEHWVNHMAVPHRIPGNDLPDSETSDLLLVPNKMFMPSETDQRLQRMNYIVLVSRILVENIPAFESMKEVCVYHIPHKHSELTKVKSKKVNFIICYS